ncbi:MAG: hypothetical protein ACI82G_002884 [Bradymonadia bacterium]|jgi:hypothetical protein
MTLSLATALVLAISASVLMPSAASACAGCRNPNLPAARSDAGPVTPGSVLLQVAAAVSHVRVSHAAGCDEVVGCAVTPIQPAYDHNLTIVPAQLQATLAVGATEAVAFELAVPIRLVSSGVNYTTPDGDRYSPLDGGIHHRNELLVGLGDMTLSSRGTWQFGRWWLTGRLGVRLPTGHTEEDPFALGDRGVAHQHIQFGTGTFDPLAGIDATYSTSGYETSLYVQGDVSLYENRHGFRGPARGLVGFAGGWKVSQVTVLGMSLEGSFEGAERWSGLIRQDASLGRSEMLLGPSVTWRRGITTLHAAARFVVLRKIVEGSEDPGTIRAPATLLIGATWALR